MDSKIIDIHIHFGAPGDKESGCFWSKEFEKTVAYYAMLIITNTFFKKVNINRVKNHLLKVIKDSKYINKCVLLAMDYTFDENGNKHEEWTHLYVPNTYISKLSKENEKILFGASIHPYRNDWQDEMDYCLENKAVLCKWIPSSQLINPAHSKCIPFYKKLAKHHLPLLCHAGPEYAVPTSNKKYNQYNNPKYLRNALDEGVTVIMAHCALPYFGFLENKDYQDDLKDFYKLFNEAEKNNWKLFADLSACATPFREPYLNDIINRIPHNKLLFGSDYPIPISEFCYKMGKNFFSWIFKVTELIFKKNPLDKNYEIFKSKRFNDCIFTNASELLGKIRYQ